MKNNYVLALAGIIMITGFISPATAFGQSQEAVVNKYMQKLTSGKPVCNGVTQKYRMTAIYTNRDFYGNFTGKIKVTGDYTWGLENGSVSWDNVYISNSNDFTGEFPKGEKQDYMENFRYIPSSEMLSEDAFKEFPSGAMSVFAKNLVWDMGAVEGFAWDYSDSLQLNSKYIISNISGEFEMADIGTYDHVNIQLCWTGISYLNNELCAVIEYRAIDNKLELTLEQMKSQGTEQYWGTTWISLNTRQIEYAEMYGGTIQEIEIKGLSDKIFVKTIRELWVERIK